ncbi:iron ABC transporter permease [Roseiarcaceae bacterium H3SJ34-1]|uniref:FecCD family ABC transporter permease n=1 Tax=Terripilifer ovatus TaxID=3032367 RepID=UPI003AB97FD9|nr:iron ABC transporter permease [Roseiarcaceae bacterium H3SJ34-1]
MVAEPRAPSSQTLRPALAPAAVLLPVLVVLLCIAAVFALAIGPARLSLHEIFGGLTGSNETAAIIVREIRLPRLILSLSIGAMLGLAGAGIQGLSRNPLAEPAIIGTPQAAALGAVLTIYSGLADTFSFALPIAAIAGAMISMVITLAAVRRIGGVTSLLLIGLTLGSLAGSAISLVLSLSSNPYAVTEIVFWLMGSFADRSMQHVVLSLPFIVVGAAAILYCAPAYKALTLGEDTAASLGFDVWRVSILTAGGISLGVGAATAVAGAIGFVGLMAPHLARPFLRSDPQRILVPSALIGALLTTTADILVRLIPSTSEIRVGALLAVIGAPCFLYLVIFRPYRLDN